MMEESCIFRDMIRSILSSVFYSMIEPYDLCGRILPSVDSSFLSA